MNPLAKPDAKRTAKGYLKPRNPCLTLPQGEQTPVLNRGLGEGATPSLPGRRLHTCPLQISFHHRREAELHCIWDHCLLLGKKAEKYSWPLHNHQLCSLFKKQLFECKLWKEQEGSLLLESQSLSSVFNTKVSFIINGE